MKPADIKALRMELRCTPLELGEALGVSAKVVMAWEQEEQFPTKRYVDMMEALRARGSGAVPRLRRGGGDKPPFEVLADPDLWRLIRKIIAHHELRAQVGKLAESYEDPA